MSGAITSRQPNLLSHSSEPNAYILDLRPQGNDWSAQDRKLAKSQAKAILSIATLLTVPAHVAFEIFRPALLQSLTHWHRVVFVLQNEGAGS